MLACKKYNIIICVYVNMLTCIIWWGKYMNMIIMVIWPSFLPSFFAYFFDPEYFFWIHIFFWPLSPRAHYDLHRQPLTLLASSGIQQLHDFLARALASLDQERVYLQYTRSVIPLSFQHHLSYFSSVRTDPAATRREYPHPQVAPERTDTER